MGYAATAFRGRGVQPERLGGAAGLEDRYLLVQEHEIEHSDAPMLLAAASLESYAVASSRYVLEPISRAYTQWNAELFLISQLQSN